MTHLLDTDHISILQRPAGSEYPVLVANINLHPVGSVVASVVSFHEQSLGAHNFINQAKSTMELVRRYELLNQLLEGYRDLPVLPFDARAARELDALKSSNLRIGTMDLRLAATAKARNLVIVTRNVRDFGRIPGLRIEDWTK